MQQYRCMGPLELEWREWVLCQELPMGVKNHSCQNDELYHFGQGNLLDTLGSSSETDPISGDLSDLAKAAVRLKSTFAYRLDCKIKDYQESSKYFPPNFLVPGFTVSYLGNVALLVLIWQNHAHAGLGSQRFGLMCQFPHQNLSPPIMQAKSSEMKQGASGSEDSSFEEEGETAVLSGPSSHVEGFSEIPKDVMTLKPVIGLLMDKISYLRRSHSNNHCLNTQKGYYDRPDWVSGFSN
ncbi:hypothetical protein V8E53_014026 [Lactarius tabidus]